MMFQVFTQVFVFIIVGVVIMALYKKLLEWRGVDFAVLWLLILITANALLGVAVFNEATGFYFWLPLYSTMFLFVLPILIDWQKRR